MSINRKMAINSNEPIKFFLPGPTWVREDVREAMLQPVVGHRSPSFKQLYTTFGPRLERVFRTRTDTPLATGSATLVMESAVVSCVGAEVLNLTCGAFSERWHAISRLVGKKADRVSVPWGRAVDPDLVRVALRKKRYDAVTTVHNETSTGVINPLEELARVVREESDALLLVDTVSSLGGAAVETDAWGLDVVLASVQKALAAPPGVTVFAISERAVERAATVADRGLYTDLVRYRDKHRAGGTITTPAVSVLYALDRQLDVVMDEGMEARWARHLELRDRTLEWAAARGYEAVAEAGAQSPTISCLKPRLGIDPPSLVGALAERGFVVGGGYGDWKATTFRIGHMGEVRLSDLNDLLKTIDVVSAELA